MNRRAVCFATAATLVTGATAWTQGRAWYSEGNFAPEVRFALELTNTLPFDRVNVPVVIRRDLLPFADVHELALTVVDPSLPPAPEPTAEQLRRNGGHELRAEKNGHILLQQMDDLDKDGVWDELFFVTNIAKNATQGIDIYVGMNQRGWNPHETHAGLGSYVRHLVPFWESKNVGWKLWFPTSVDVYGKRKPLLMAHRLYMENLDGYGVSMIDPALGSDIQSVDDSFGAAGICVFDTPGSPNVPSVPRHTPRRTAMGVKENFNAGPIGDTRYAFDVVVNGPVRSMVRVKTMNWNSGAGSYEVEQLYTAYANQSYSTAHVRFARFLPERAGAVPCVGMRKKPNEKHLYRQDGVVMSGGPESIVDPDDGTIEQAFELISGALVVKPEYRPEYRFVSGLKGNHTFAVQPKADGTFEYLIANAWSDGAVLKTWDAFENYVKTTAQEYESPLRIRVIGEERRR